jgi:hypothetical protein
MANKQLEELQYKVTDLNQRMCQVEHQQDLIGVQLGTISENLSGLNDRALKERKHFERHLTWVGAWTTLLITVALVLFYVLK